MYTKSLQTLRSVFSRARHLWQSEMAMSYMIDTHCHLVDNKFKTDVDDVIERARSSGVKHAVVCPEYASQFNAVLELKSQHPDFVLPAIGVHPIQKKNKSVKLENIEGVEEFLIKHRDQICCIGEFLLDAMRHDLDAFILGEKTRARVGLDFTERYNIGPEKMAVQKEVLAKHIEWAKQLKLPLTVHSRSACGDTVDFLIENNATMVAPHAFNGSLEEALRGLKAGFFFSIPPSFTTGDHKRFLIDAIPLEKLLLETDSPVLGPVRGERNEPANLRLSAEFIANVKKVPVEEVISKTTKNAEMLLGLKSE